VVKKESGRPASGDGLEGMKASVSSSDGSGELTLNPAKSRAGMQGLFSQYWKFVAIALQLCVLLVVLRQFQIESSAFREVVLLAFAGFAVHYFLPERFRLGFFAVLSVGATFLVFGFADGAWLAAFALVMMGICHLPFNVWIRGALLIAVGGFAAMARVEFIQGPWSQAIWPILASMFMFRVIVYLYDSRYEKISFTRGVSYFFMLPNVCFPLFPVVDYKGFRRTYYNEEQHKIYQTGIDWMVRGIVQLILYRVMYYYVAISPSEVIDPNSLTRYLISNFLLYLRISGDFHLITGMLHLFGFNVIPTHHLYCLAESFTDFWRRINIYWKDFMMKIFYYPIVFKLRRFGDVPALIITTIVVFIMTWLLHSYQWFWLRGDFPLTWQDGVFWMSLAVLVVFGSLREYRHGRERRLSSQKPSFSNWWRRGIRTVCTFFVICILWSVWTSESAGTWLSLWDFLWEGIPEEGSAFPGLLLAVACIVFVLAGLFGQQSSTEKSVEIGKEISVSQSTLVTLVALLVLTPIGLPQVYKSLGTDVSNMIVSLKSGQLSRADAAALERGYYEDLTRVNRFNSQLWELYMKRPTVRLIDIQNSGLSRARDDFLQTELVPNFRSYTPYGVIETNRWGMRDKDYAKKPGGSTVRIAVLGYSTVMGWGVEQDSTFEAVLERRLNEHTGTSRHTEFETLNLAVPGYDPPQQVAALERAMEFSPQMVFYVAGGREQWRAVQYVAQIVSKNVLIPYAGLSEIVARANVRSDMAAAAILKRLKVHEHEVLKWVYSRIAKRCIDNQIRPVWVFLPPTSKTLGVEEDFQASRKMAVDAGFTVIDLTEVYAGHDPESLWIAEWDRHPNTHAHQLVADALYDAMVESPGIFMLTRQ